jgi:hypothetical protein
MQRVELLKEKADLERELGRLVLHCSDCGRTVHWVVRLSTTAGHWAHREAAPHGPTGALLGSGTLIEPTLDTFEALKDLTEVRAWLRCGTSPALKEEGGERRGE